MEKTVSKFLESLAIPVSRRHCEKLILSHPDYPSMLSISDTLARLGIEHYAFQANKEELHQLTFPYLLHLEKGGGQMLLLRDAEELKRNERSLKYWSGVVLQAAPTTSITDAQNNKLYQEERYFRRITRVLIVSVVLLLSIPFIISHAWASMSYMLMLFTAICGVTTGYLLVAKDLGIRYQAVESFCNAGSNANCDKVLNSESARLLGPIKFSDAVLTFFASQLVVITLIGALPASASSYLLVLTASAIFTFPVVLFSLYYQHFKAKAWCRLCLVVDATLIVQAAILTYTVAGSSIRFDNDVVSAALTTALIFLSSGALILILKNLTDNNNRLFYAEVKSNRVKHAPSVFVHQLLREKRVDVTPFEQELLIGDPDAPVKIVAGINLFCNPCKINHEKLENLLAMYPGKVNVAIRFLSSRSDLRNNPTGIQSILQYALLHIFGERDQYAKAGKLMSDWYRLWDLKKFRELYPVEVSSDAGHPGRKLEAQHVEWIREADVTETPTLFINGYKLPRRYNADDLIAVVPGLADYLEKTNLLSDKVVLLDA